MILTKILSHFEVIQSMLNLSVCHKVFQHAEVHFYQLNCHTTKNKHQFDVKIMSENILDSVEDDENETIEGEMDFMEKNALQRCRTQIVKDLDIRLIVDDLIAFKVISESDYELIKNQVSGLKELTKVLGK